MALRLLCQRQQPPPREEEEEEEEEEQEGEERAGLRSEPLRQWRLLLYGS